jgi:hypothetical protein
MWLVGNGRGILERRGRKNLVTLTMEQWSEVCCDLGTGIAPIRVPGSVRLSCPGILVLMLLLSQQKNKHKAVFPTSQTNKQINQTKLR